MLRLEKSNVKKNIATAYSKKLSSQGYSYVMKMKYSDFQFYIKPGKKSLYVLVHMEHWEHMEKLWLK